jgi:arabinofuranosyltransferase
VRSGFRVGDRLGFTLFDDAMISMRYARNLAEGSGLVWNPGERVEGYTNPLWTVWMAVIHVTGVSDDRASLAVMISGALLLLSTAAVAAGIAERVFRSPEVAVAAFALVAFNYALVFWTLRGMEVGLLALPVTLALGLTLSVEARAETQPGFFMRLLCLCLTLVLAEATRREASLLHLIVMLHVAWTMRGRPRLVALSALAVTLAAALGAQTAFSAWYYGDPLPNTYYLKLEGVTLLARLRRGVPALAIVVVRNLLPLLIAALFVLRHARWPAVRHPVALFVAAVGVQAAYSAYVGGDVWEATGYTNRYLTTIVPALSILAAAGIRELSLAGADLRTRFVSLLLATLALRLMLKAVLHMANGSVLLHGTTWFELHRTAWLGVLWSVAFVLLGWAAAVAFRSRPAERRQLRSATRRGPVFAAAVLAVWTVANGSAFIWWVGENALYVSYDTRDAQTGLMLRRVTAPEAVIAVTSAGNVPYFSRRRAIDILGKSDPSIAHMAPVGSFVPGHNKWNLDHSIRDGRPDLILGLPRAPGDVDYLVRLGYRSYPGGCFARGDSDRVDHAALWQGLTALYPDEPPIR